VILLAVVLSALAALFSLMAFLRAGALSRDGMSRLLREETDRLRQGDEERERNLRGELSGLLRAGSDQVRGMLGEAAAREEPRARALREELLGAVALLGQTLGETLRQSGTRQKELLEGMSASLAALTEKNERAMEQLRQSVEGRLDALRTENQMKLDEMRRTVDEKLQTTLETRLGESFGRVAEQLERVHKSIGEMQSLATGVGDLKRVLLNVRSRGTFGEVQLGALLDQFLAPEQYVKNAQVREHTQERVEFAIRLPGREAEGEVLLPVDAKFPQEDYERLLDATEAGDAAAAAQAAKELEARIRSFARTIREKYIEPPRTTDFALLFLPTEGLYAEVLRRPGLFEQIQREFHVTLAGPTTLAAILNALQMGFRSLAIERRSGEVWKILGAVRQEFGKYNEVVEKLSAQLSTAANSVRSLGTRSRAMDRKLREVERLPEAEARELLGGEIENLADPAGEEE
jgi:DNA recombination protein RmuC